MGLSLKPDDQNNNNGYNANGYNQNGYMSNQYGQDYGQYQQAQYQQAQYQQNLYGAGLSAGLNMAPARDEITEQKFNLIIGGCLLWGFLVNVFMVKFCFAAAYDAIVENYLIFLIAYIAMAVIGTIMIKKSDNPVISFIGYNLFVVPLGLVISFVVNIYTGIGAGDIVTAAFGITAVVTLVMMAAASIFPGFFLSIGRVLGISLLVAVVLEIILMLAGITLGIFDYIIVVIFCGYVGYDWAKANALPKTVDNAVDCAAELYIDIVNLFLRIMRILARANR